MLSLDNNYRNLGGNTLPLERLKGQNNGDGKRTQLRNLGYESIFLQTKKYFLIMSYQYYFWTISYGISLLIICKSKYLHKFVPTRGSSKLKQKKTQFWEKHTIVYWKGAYSYMANTSNRHEWQHLPLMVGYWRIKKKLWKSSSYN